MKVKCIDEDGNGFIREGKVYEVVSRGNNSYTIINEQPSEFMYKKHLFEVVQEPSTMEVKLTLPEIEGYEYTGEYRQANNNEPHKFGAGVRSNINGTMSEYIILKKKAPKYRTVESKPETPAQEVVKYVEIKALEDLMVIVDRINSGADFYLTGFENYSEIKKLIN